MGTEVLLEVSGQGSQELQGGLEGQAGVGPQVSSQTLHYLGLTKHNLGGDSQLYQSIHQSTVTLYLSQRGELLQFLIKFLELSAQVEFPPV